jgi:vitamin B12 transporter
MNTKARLAVRSALAFVGFASFNAAAYADDNTVVVTATRTEQSLSEVGQSISVIDAEAIRQRQSDTVVDLLRNLPGVTFARNGGVGTSTSIFIRGAESDQTVALIDGVKLNDPAAPGGGFNFGSLLVGNISRIEVLRGSQSVLWGSQAIGGVVNVTTAEPTDQLAANARAEYGWHDTKQLVGNVSQKIGPVSASIGAGEFHTDGISAFDENLGGVERDGFRNFRANAKFDIAVTDNVSVDLRGFYSNGKVGIDGFAPPTFSFGDTNEYSRTREFVGYSALNVGLLDGRFHNRIAAESTDTRRKNFDPDGFVFETFDANGRNTRFEYQGVLDISESLRSTFGVETERSRFDTSSFGGPVTRGDTRLNSGYAELVAKPLTGLTTTVGVRHDHHDQFGGKTTTGASAAYTPNQGLTVLRASYSEGFKAPTLYQLQSEFGNGLLQPENARGFDAGITQRFFGERVEVSATAFRSNSHDLINFISCVEPFDGICTNRPNGTYNNVSRARSEGVELTAQWKPLDALALQANYTHLNAEDRSPGSAAFGKNLVRRPGETASALVDYRLPFGLETGVTLTHAGSSFDNASNTRRIQGYEVVDLRLAYPVTSSIEVQGRVENLLDEQYETIYRYGMPGRAAYVGARLSY